MVTSVQTCSVEMVKIWFVPHLHALKSGDQVSEEWLLDGQRGDLRRRAVAHLV